MNNKSQYSQMCIELSRLFMGTFVFAAFAWIGFFSFLKKQTLPPSFIWAILSTVLFFISCIAVRKLRRAYKYYLIIVFLSILNAMLLFDSSLRLIYEIEIYDHLAFFGFILISIILALIGTWSQFQIVRNQLKASIQGNVKSGRLNLKDGYWNLEAPLCLGAPEVENATMKKINQLSKFSPLVVALGFSLARAVEGKTQVLFFGICLYVLGYIVAWGYTKFLVIAIQLREWEDIYHVKISI